MVIQIINFIIELYQLLLLIRILASWFPQADEYRWMQFLAYYTDPYLNFFRRFIPPIGGVLDLSPIVGILVLTYIIKPTLLMITHALFR